MLSIYQSPSTHSPSALCSYPRLLLTAILSSVFMLSACSNSNNQQSSQSAPTNNTEAANVSDADKPNYVVATVKIFKPFVMRDEEFQLTGFDIDVIDAIAKDQDFNITYAVVPRKDLYEGIINNRYDMAIAGISITPERQESMTFSEPYFTSHKAVIAGANAKAITNFEQLASYNVAVIANGTSAEVLENIMPDKTRIQYVETPYNTIEQVIQKKSDYALGDSPVLSYYANDLKDLNLQVYTDQQLPAEPYGIVFAKNRDDELLQKINLGLQHIKADGTYQVIEKKWFGE